MADRDVFNIKPYLILRYLFGYYHNIICSGNRVRLLLKSVSVLFFILIFFIGTLCRTRTFGIVGLITSSVQYIINVICSLYTEDEYLLEYYRYNALIDDKRNKKFYAKLKIILKGYLIIVMVSHTVVYGLNGVLFGARKQNPCVETWQYYLMGTIRLAMSLGRLPVLAVFGLFYCRIHLFCRKIQQTISTNTVFFRYKKYMQIYEHIRTTFHKTDFPIKVLIFANLFVEFWDIPNVQYNMVTQFSSSTLLISFVHFASSLVVFFPCLIMEMISEDIEKMRVMVADKMISCNNDDQGMEYRCFLECLRHRPMVYVIWRAFKMDSRLLLSYLSLVVTYLVCLLQFKPILFNYPVATNSTAQ